MIDPPLWKARFADWLEVRYRSQDTHRSYLGPLNAFLEFILALGITSWAELNQDVLEEYRAHVFALRHPRTGNALRVVTQIGRLMAVKVFCKFLVRDGFILANPAAQLELPRHKPPLPLVLTESEVLKLLDAPDTEKLTGIRDRAILEVLYGTGLRNGEMCSLTLDLLDLATHQVRLQRGKGDKGRILPLGQEAQVWLELYLESVRPFWLRNPSVTAVFLDRWGSGPITRSTVSMIVRALGKKAGLGKAATPHSLRHSCATHMLRRGAGLRHIQQMLGHEQLSSTEHYTKVEVTDLRRVLSRCHPRETFKKP
jgi:integrase/recombinase XerD